MATKKAKKKPGKPQARVNRVAEMNPNMIEAETLEIVRQLGVDFERRIVYLDGEVNDTTAMRITTALLHLDKTSGPITVFISSPGGSEPAGFTIYDIIRSLENETITVGIGWVYSIAALIIQAGKVRLLSENAKLMQHNGHLEIGLVQSDKIPAIAKDLASSNSRYQEAIAERSGVPLKQVREWCLEERIFSSEEAVKHGFADGIYQGWKKK